MIRGLCGTAPRGRWQRLVLWSGGLALAVLVAVLAVAALVRR
jgi:hypothetical protein